MNVRGGLSHHWIISAICASQCATLSFFDPRSWSSSSSCLFWAVSLSTKLQSCRRGDFRIIVKDWILLQKLILNVDTLAVWNKVSYPVCFCSEFTVFVTQKVAFTFKLLLQCTHGLVHLGLPVYTEIILELVIDMRFFNGWRQCCIKIYIVINFISEWFGCSKLSVKMLQFKYLHMLTVCK